MSTYTLTDDDVDPPFELNEAEEEAAEEALERYLEAAWEERDRAEKAKATASITEIARAFLSEHPTALSVTVLGEYNEIDGDHGARAWLETETRVRFTDGSMFAKNNRGQARPELLTSQAMDVWNECEALADDLNELGVVFDDQRGVTVTREAVRDA